MAPVPTGPMNGRVLRYVFAIIFCAGAWSTLIPHPQHPIRETQPSSRAEISEKVERKYSSENCVISAAKTHTHSGFLLSLLLGEVEESDDEKDVSDLHREQANSSEIHHETAFVDFLRPSGHVSSIPLFIFLHSWRHFLS